MKNTFLTVALILGLFASAGCGISARALRETQEAAMRPTFEAQLYTAVPATLTAMAATQRVALLSFHGRYVTAMGAGGGWLLKQEPALSDCGWFTLQHLKNGKVTMMTCHDRYVTAPETGTTRSDWLLWQESELGDRGQFLLHDLGGDGVALETCAGSFVTAGDGNWPGDLAWSIVGEADRIQAWERFTMLLQP